MWGIFGIWRLNAVAISSKLSASPLHRMFVRTYDRISISKIKFKELIKPGTQFNENLIF